MRRAPQALLLFVIILVVAACGAPAASQGNPEQSTHTSQPSDGGQPSEAAEPSDGGGGGGGGAEGSVTYQINGDVSGSGELPFIPLGMTQFIENGWVAYFGETDGDVFIQIYSVEGQEAVLFNDTVVSIPGSEGNGCTFDFTENDSDRLAGSFDCNDSIGLRSGTTDQVQVDFSGQFEGNP